MSGDCQFCGMWHSGPCCHPSRYIMDMRDAEIARLTDAHESALATIAEQERTIAHLEAEADACVAAFKEETLTLLEECERQVELIPNLSAFSSQDAVEGACRILHAAVQKQPPTTEALDRMLAEAVWEAQYMEREAMLDEVAAARREGAEQALKWAGAHQRYVDLTEKEQEILDMADYESWPKYVARGLTALGFGDNQS